MACGDFWDTLQVDHFSEYGKLWDLLFVVHCKVSKILPSLTVDTVFKSLRLDHTNMAVTFRALRFIGIMELIQQIGMLQRHLRGKKTLTGCSASRSEPYIRTRLAHLSRSEIFLGNQGSSEIAINTSTRKTASYRDSVIPWCIHFCVNRKQFYHLQMCSVCLVSPWWWCLFVFSAVEWFCSASLSHCHSQPTPPAQSYVSWTSGTRYAKGWYGVPGFKCYMNGIRSKC